MPGVAAKAGHHPQATEQLLPLLQLNTKWPVKILHVAMKMHFSGNLSDNFQFLKLLPNISENIRL